MSILQALKKTSLNPKKLFVIDGLGALVSAFSLGIVLVKLESVFGIPKKTLYFLAFIPCVFALFDLYCYFKNNGNFAVGLKIIAFANLLYCCLSIGFAFYHHQKLTTLGWLYIIIEIAIVASIAYVELRAARKLSAKK